MSEETQPIQPVLLPIAFSTISACSRVWYSASIGRLSC